MGRFSAKLMSAKMEGEVLLTDDNDDFLVLDSQIDEVDSLEDDAAIFSVEKMANILRKGSESQRTVILFEIQQLLEHCFQETLDSLVPVLCENVHLWSDELQISASEAISDIVQRPIPKKSSKMISDAAFRVLGMNRTEDSFEAWGEILVVVLPEVEWTGDEEISSVITTIDEFSKTDYEACRKLAARVLGSLSVCLKIAEVENFVLQRALAMSEDKDVEVRGMVAESFAFLGAALDIQVTEKLVWPRLLSLLEDPDSRIHAACIRTIAHIVDAKRNSDADAIMFKQLLPPVFKRECAFGRRAASEDQRTVEDDTYLLLEIIAEVYGPFLHAVHPHFADENEKKEAFKAFLAMSTCNGPIVRRYCAYNLPGVALSLKSRYTVELAGVTEYLSRDSDSETRWNLAAGIHETCNILMSKNSADNLFKSAIALLEDENPLVRMNTLEHFQELLQAFTKDAENTSQTMLTPVFQKLNLLSEGNWRTQELLAQQLEKVSDMVPFSCLQDNILPLLYQMAEEGTHRVRKKTMPAIAKTIWCIPRPQEREEILNTFYSEWGQGGVFWMRIAFVDCAEAALKLFSCELYSYLFAPALYQLARDNVPNVRLRVASMLHQLAPFCYRDEEYQASIAWLRNDIDKDVLATMAGIDDKIADAMKDMKTFRRENEAREEVEAKLEERAERERKDAQKRVRANKTKMKAATILPKIATKAGNMSTLNAKSVNLEASPVSIAASGKVQKSSSRLGAMLPVSLSKAKDSTRQGSSSEEQTTVPSSPRSAGRKALKQLLGVGSSKKNKQHSEQKL